MPKPEVTFSTFQVLAYLDNETVIAEYLSSAAQDENPDVLLKALVDVAKARGMAQVAKDERSGPRKPLQSPQPRRKAEIRNRGGGDAGAEREDGGGGELGALLQHVSVTGISVTLRGAVHACR